MSYADNDETIREETLGESYSNIRGVKFENHHDDSFKHTPILNIHILVLRPRQLLPEILLRIIIDFYFRRESLFRDSDDYF